MMYQSHQSEPKSSEKVSDPVPGRIAIIDIGSNSIRLVVYENAGRYPFPLFNERMTCKLGFGIDKTGKLNTKNLDAALRALQRFRPILHALGPEKLIAVATAAVRRASNADIFLKPAAEILGQPVTVISGIEEARLIAKGLTASAPNLTGVIADLGGSSLELVQVDDGEITNSASLYIGHLSTATSEDIRSIIETVPWLSDLDGHMLYGIGGSFRAIGAAHIADTNYPLRLLHGLTIRRKQAKLLLKALVKDKPSSTIPADRRETIPMAANIIRQLMKLSKVSGLTISGTSIRDGILADLQKDEDTDQDPLITVCSEIAERGERYPGFNKALSVFLRPIFIHFSDVIPERLCIAACQLSDICWNEHPDMRGVLAVDKILALPVFSLSHTERALLAKMIFHRYVGVKKYKETMTELDQLIDEQSLSAVKSIGLALRFAHMYSAGVGSLLAGLKLSLTDTSLNLYMPLLSQQLLDGHSMRRLKLLAQALDRDLILQT